MHDFLAEFKYGDIVPHSWLVAHFGLPLPDDTMSAASFQARQFEWLSSIEGFKSTLLHDHQVLLQSVRGEGYRWVPPPEQTQAATKEFERDARKAFRTAGNRLKNIRHLELTEDQRRTNVDALARLSQLRGTTRALLR
ncbi:hypothetical protein [Diaphorobacter sp. HDW4B]|uniref:hypothetical protein n=1 Tax=Diaphorobacter sp. HDW4B TaxID=2714925 RepID=UPI00197AB9B0|nr:hypothetical protein [Diaphorobacter sp. HDW4B]